MKLEELLNAELPNHTPTHEEKRRSKYKHQSRTNPVDCVCKEPNELIRPAVLESSCSVFNVAMSSHGVTSDQLLSLKTKVKDVVYPYMIDEYNRYRLNYNRRFNYYPILISKVACTKEIAETISFCTKYNLPFRARGGSHAYAPASLVNSGVIIDQAANHNQMTIDHANHTVTIQGGALLGPVINELAKHNLTVPFGTCVTNGLAGLVLGGGMGFLTRRYGLTSDNLLDTKIVLADGSITHANCTTNPDLFWALKGAGCGNFGIVSTFTFRTYELPWVTVFTILFDYADTKVVLNTWQNLTPYVTSRLTCGINMRNRFQPLTVTGQLTPGNSRIEDQERLYELIQPFIALGLHNSISIKTLSLLDAAKYYGKGSYARPVLFYNQSEFNFAPLTEEAMDTIVYHMDKLTIKQSFFSTEIDSLGGNFAKIDSSAFASRDALMWIQFTSAWDFVEDSEENISWLRTYYADMRKYFPMKRRYVGALDYDISREEALTSYYGPNVPELMKIKSKYDPRNVFNFEQSIPV
jgi:FAD/FMN-containing dehydrogenase